MTAIAASGKRDQRPETSMRTPQMSATTARIRLIDMVTSRKLARRSCNRRAASVERSEEAIDRCQPRVQDPRLHAEADAQVPFGSEVDARNDHRAVLAYEPVDEVHRVDRVLVAEEADRTRGRRRPVKLARMP